MFFWGKNYVTQTFSFSKNKLKKFKVKNQPLHKFQADEFHMQLNEHLDGLLRQIQMTHMDNLTKNERRVFKWRQNDRKNSFATNKI